MKGLLLLLKVLDFLILLLGLFVLLLLVDMGVDVLCVELFGCMDLVWVLLLYIDGILVSYVYLNCNKCFIGFDLKW